MTVADLYAMMGLVEFPGLAGCRRRPPDEWTVFVPRAFDGSGWVRIAPPQREARAACLAVTAHIRSAAQDPAEAEPEDCAVLMAQMLENGLTRVAMIGGRHRVDRIDL